MRGVIIGDRESNLGTVQGWPGVLPLKMRSRALFIRVCTIVAASLPALVFLSEAACPASARPFVSSQPYQPSKQPCLEPSLDAVLDCSFPSASSDTAPAAEAESAPLDTVTPADGGLGEEAAGGADCDSNEEGDVPCILVTAVWNIAKGGKDSAILDPDGKGAVDGSRGGGGGAAAALSDGELSAQATSGCKLAIV